MIINKKDAGYYVSESGRVCSTETAPIGCHFEIEVEGDYKKLLIIADSDGEVLQEFVFWPSLLEAMQSW